MGHVTPLFTPYEEINCVCGEKIQPILKLLEIKFSKLGHEL